MKILLGSHTFDFWPLARDYLQLVVHTEVISSLLLLLMLVTICCCCCCDGAEMFPENYDPTGPSSRTWARWPCSPWRPLAPTGSSSDHREAVDDVHWEVWGCPAWGRTGRPCDGPDLASLTQEATSPGRYLSGLAGRGGTWEGEAGTSLGCSTSLTPWVTCWVQEVRALDKRGWRPRRSCLDLVCDLHSHGTWVLHWD